MSEKQARYGWESNFPTFSRTPARVIRGRLEEFVRDAGDRQVRAWDESIPPLQREVDEVLSVNEDAATYSAILEYELPLESRRPDVVLLAKSAVVILELKGKLFPSQADLDQASAYARDLRCYHRECEHRPVVPIVVPTRAKGYIGNQAGVQIAGPDALDSLVDGLAEDPDLPPLSREQFLAESAYCPLPTLVRAARELFNSGNLRTIRRARAATDPAVDEISRIIHEAAATRTRRLVLVTGIPGSGKTLVGLRIVHAHFLDDLAVPRANGKPTAPAIFLSGNGPLVEVLQYELRGAGGGGRTFVRGVKDYVKTYSVRPGLIPPEHVLVFDEAQRAFDAEMVSAKHANTPGFTSGRSEPEHFVEFAERIPEWCVVIGLIGGGQEIHVGEEAGLIQWRHAVERSNGDSDWVVHGAPAVRTHFEGSRVTFEERASLNLDTEIRFHLGQGSTPLCR
ncbi:MAG: DNA/RNA helicase domain-containing protein [Acidobacteriota bacterium]